MIKVTRKEIIEEFDASGNLLKRTAMEETSEETLEEPDVNQIRIEGFQ